MIRNDYLNKNNKLGSIIQPNNNFFGQYNDFNDFTNPGMPDQYNPFSGMVKTRSKSFKQGLLEKQITNVSALSSLPNENPFGNVDVLGQPGSGKMTKRTSFKPY